MEPHELPDGWDWKPIRSVVEPKETWNPSRQPRAKFRYIEISSIDDGSVSIAQTREVDGNKAPTRAKKVIRTGDVIFATTRPYLKNVAIVPKELDQEICSTGFCVLRPKTDEITGEWLYFACRSDLVVDQVVPNQEKSAYPAVSDDEVLDALIPVPSLAEQRRIVARINDLAHRLEFAHRLHREAVAAMRAYLPSLFRSTYERLVGAYGSVALRELGTPMGGGTPSKGKRELWKGDIPWIAPKYMKIWQISDSVDRISELGLESSSAQLIPSPAVLFVVRGMILARSVPVAVSTRPLAINQDMKALMPHSGVEAEFVAYMMRGAETELLRMVEVATHGTHKLRTERWSGLPIPVPPQQVQRRIVAALNERRSRAEVVSNVQRTVEAELASFMPALLSKAVRGKLFASRTAISAVEEAEPSHHPLSDLVSVAAYIVNRLHDAPTHGKKKLAKALHLAQYHLRVSLGWRPLRKAAGPYNWRIHRNLEALAAELGYFSVRPRVGATKGGVRYIPGTKISDGVAAAKAVLGNKQAEFDRLLRLLDAWDSDTAEMYATLYAVWNDFLIEGIEPTDQQIVEGVLTWSHEKRTKFAPTMLRAGIDQMGRDGLVPTGFGPKTKQEEKRLFD